MVVEAKCPSCGKVFTVEEFSDICCPKCSREASWDYTEDLDLEDNDVWYPEWSV